ncbi:bacterioferritin [Candidatus Zinderia endosymbiont of Aphrophora alni]|uniref:bacterioferritin n=1 Tax=Candidatus Zinderia endosymbiont of Aphrophora alni TaxID=3077951 RepID=UPI0030CC28B9
MNNLKIINLLNDQLINELIASNQYFLNSIIYKHLGYKKIALKEKNESKEELKHAKKILNRILTLEGKPNIEILNKFIFSNNIEEILKNNLYFEKKIQKNLKKNILICEKKYDYITRILLEEILYDSIKHIKWIKFELNIINIIGIKDYLKIQIN